MRALLAALGWMFASTAWSLDAGQGGTFWVLDSEGQPSGKVFRATAQGAKWKFEDLQPDGSWLDVSCHGGCEHRPSQVQDLVAFFGSPPPPTIRPQCVHNQQFAFCHFVPADPDAAVEGYVLVIRDADHWHPLSLVRVVPAAPSPQVAPLEGARWVP